MEQRSEQRDDAQRFPIAVDDLEGRSDVLAAGRMWQPSLRSLLRQLVLASADALGNVAAGCAAWGLTGSDSAAKVTLLTLPIWLTVAKAQGLYDADESKTWHRTTDELPRILYFVTLSLALSWVVMSFVGVGGLDGTSAIAAWSAGLVVSTGGRAIARGAWKRFVPSERSIVVGDGRSAGRVTRKLLLERGHHLSVVGQVAHDGSRTADALREMIADTYAHRVIVAVDELDDPTLRTLNDACREAGVKLSVVPPMQSVLRSAYRIHHVAEMPMVELPTAGASPLALAVKRAMDVVGSALLLVVSSPLLIGLAIAVRLDSKGGALFRQQRAGAGGKPFTMVKFRSMAVDAEARLADVVDVTSLVDPVFKIKGDPRVTRVGAFIRATSLDELPQLWNVLRGHMSLVGPRPEELKVVERYDDEARSIRLAMKPGLTGPMQIHGRGELTFAERLDVERDYVEHYRLGRDVGILMRTISVVLFRQGAY